MSKTIPPTCPEPQTGPKYWRGLDELSETPEFQSWLEREFPQGASELTDPVNRRNFVKIMSASFLLAGVGLGASGCRRPEEKILPFSRLPEGYVHGVAQYYATAFPTRGGAIPLLAKSNDGRPTKLEGNAQHPDSNGGTDRFAQASILNLYDPDRAIRYAKGGSVSTKEAALDFLNQLSQQAAANKGEGLCFLLERGASPSRARLQKLIKAKFPQARWFVYEPVDFDIHRDAASKATGQPVAPYFRFDKAKRILSLDCDFIGAEEDNHRFIRDFAKGRKIENPEAPKNEDLINRLYVVESLMSLTGANADHRLRIASSQVVQVAAALAVEIVKQGNGEFAALAAKIGAPAGVDAKWISECAKDLLAHAGTSLVVAGYRQPLAVHLIANAINYALGNIGQTVTFSETPDTGEGSLADLATALNAGAVNSLVIIGGNPAYNAPAELDWAKTQRKAKSVVRLGYYEDETAANTDWHLPLAHALESWGDVRTSDGTLVPVQPLIAPLFDGLTELEFLARVGGLNEKNPYEIVRETFRSLTPSLGFEENWKKFLHDGFFA
ncbi:MAG: TAT-variant-translocated molybdopterin oxidoreductase, partial [Verrucomicrobia bacterium]|nr:TAT-variant-translocated molybdopterin oxidoreductase [Verrucomicrobiota bacterium]